MADPTVVFVVGTRPDAIKSAPVVQEFRRTPGVRTVLVSTGQHREMLVQALESFGLKADIDLDIMEHGQSLADITRRVLQGLDPVIEDLAPSVLFAQGDTTTTFAAGLAAFYRQTPFAHVEAGLRTETVWDPYPEEFNRRAVALFAKWHFAPTSWAADNLRKEGISDRVYVTGNTGIDAVMETAAHHQADWYGDWAGRIVLLTTHRRENWGVPQQHIAQAAHQILDQFPDTLLVVPMHRNPQVRQTLDGVLGRHPRADLIEPPDYADFVKLMQRADLILTDSGGVQEEAPAFGKPVLVLRRTTERPEGVDAGTAKLVGTDRQTIVDEATSLLSDEAAYQAMSQAVSPYGDGKASARIRSVVLRDLGVETNEEPMWG